MTPPEQPRDVISWEGAVASLLLPVVGVIYAVVMFTRGRPHTAAWALLLSVASAVAYTIVLAA